MKIVCDCGNEGEFIKTMVSTPASDIQEGYIDTEKFRIEVMELDTSVHLTTCECLKCGKKIFM